MDADDGIYDRSTDSLYVRIRPGESVDNVADDARDLVIDLGADGDVVGYDIQHASRHPEVFAEAMRLIRLSKRGPVK